MLLISCNPTDTSTDTSTDDDPPSVTPASFTFTDEYPRFHTYYAKVSIQNAPATQATMLISTMKSPPALSSVSSDAYYTRTFDPTTDTLKTRPIYIGWNDQYTHAAAKTRRATFTNAALIVTAANASTEFAAMPWMLQANTQYYLHIYYTEDGVAKTHTRAFKTMSYPSTSAGIDSNLYSFDANLNIERKATEPTFYTAYNSAFTSSILITYDANGGGGCGSPPNPTCASATTISDFMLFVFQNSGLGDANFLQMGTFQFYDATGTPTTFNVYIFTQGTVPIARYNVTTITK